MSRCMCGAYDCGACYPTTYKQYIALENGEIKVNLWIEDVSEGGGPS